MKQGGIGLHQAPPTQQRDKAEKCRRGNNPFGHPADCPDASHTKYTILDPEWGGDDAA